MKEEKKQHLIDSMRLDEEPEPVICYDKFNIVIKDGYYVDVQNSGTCRVYKKEDKQLYFTPYDKEERVSDYFSNDIIAITYASKLMVDLKREMAVKKQQTFTKPDIKEVGKELKKYERMYKFYMISTILLCVTLLVVLFNI